LNRAPVLVLGASSAAVAVAASAMRRSLTVFVFARGVGRGGSSSVESVVVVWRFSSGSSVGRALIFGVLSSPSLSFVSCECNIIGGGGARNTDLLCPIVDDTNEEEGESVKPWAAL